MTVTCASCTALDTQDGGTVPPKLDELRLLALRPFSHKMRLLRATRVQSLGTETPLLRLLARCAGTFYHLKRKPDFYFLCNPDSTVAIELDKPAKYGMVVVEVGPDDTPEEVAARIQGAVKLAGQAGATASFGNATATVSTGAAKAVAANPERGAPLLEA